MTGVSAAMNVAGIGAGVATTAAAAAWGMPGVLIGVSVAAPVACAWELLLGHGGALTAREIRAQVEKLKEYSDHRDQQLLDAQTQIDQMTRDAETREQQLHEQDEQIKRLWEIHAQLRMALKNLAVAGDTFDHFGGVLAEHVTTLSDRIDQLDSTSAKLDDTAAVLQTLSSSLEHHIVERGLSAAYFTQ